MRRRSDIVLLALGAVTLLGIILAVGRLFDLRREDGDIYQEYSSFRTDPLGTKGLYLSLERVGAAAVERHTQSWSRLEGASGQTLLVLGVGPWAYVERTGVTSLERFMREGGRLIVGLDPAQANVDPGERWEYRQIRERERKRDRRKRDGKDDEDDSDERGVGFTTPEVEADPWGLILANWGARARREAGEARKAPAQLAETAPPGDLPQVLTLRSGVGFEAGEPWRPVYERGGRAVALERPFGRGSLVVLSDASLLSNENLATSPEPSLIAWAVGPAERIVFDEHHLGVTRRPGVMTLMRQYGLHWAFIPLAILGLLFVWRSASPLAPRDMAMEFAPTPQEMDSRDSFEGLVNLLRRNLPEAKLLETCLEEWKKTDQARRPDRARHIADMERIARGRSNASPGRAPRGGEIPEAYNEMARLLARGR